MYSSLESDLYDYLSPALIKAGITADKIAYGYENGAKLNGNYAILSITDATEDVPVEVRNTYDPDFVNNPGKFIEEHLLYRSVLTIDIDIRGDQNLSRAQTFKAMLASNQQIELAQKYNFGFVRVTQSISLPQILQQEYENRVVFSLFLNRLSVEKIDIPTIGQVTVIGTDAITGLEIVNETITEV